MSRSFWRQHPILRALLIAALVSSPVWIPMGLLVGYVAYVRYYIWTAEDRAHTESEGLPSDARRWRAVIAPIPDPDAAEHNHPELTNSRDYFCIKFPNGEWVFGRAVQSHKLVTKGGTLVLKDSRGRVRVYYGHVCSSGGSHMSAYGDRAKSLDEFYARMIEFKTFTEQTLAP